MLICFNPKAQSAEISLYDFCTHARINVFESLPLFAFEYRVSGDVAR